MLSTLQEPGAQGSLSRLLRDSPDGRPFATQLLPEEAALQSKSARLFGPFERLL